MVNKSSNVFVNAIGSEMTVTENAMPAFVSTLDKNVDLFFKIGAMRGQDPRPAFAAAFGEDPELAVRIAAWARDVRGGAGERKIFRDILQYLETTHKNIAKAMVPMIPEIGRWDDLFAFNDLELKRLSYDLIKKALVARNGLCAKWMPRKGPIAIGLRNFMGLTPKQYRKILVELTNVVETPMCAKQWDTIEFGKVPSLAAARYKKAFARNAEKAYTEYALGLLEGTGKINVGAVYPYDVIKGTFTSYGAPELQVVEAQWKALPNYIKDAKFLPVVDVSGSMTIRINKSITALDVAVSLGLYCADKNTGDFKDTMVTFSGTPELLRLRGSILDKLTQMSSSKWEMNTNIEAVFHLILNHAQVNKVPESDMPTAILIMSDMQFDDCVQGPSVTALVMMKRLYAEAGYKMPAVVFWNIFSYDNVPARFNEAGVALISGFSPAILTSVLAFDLDNLTPEKIMLKTVMVPRYDVKTYQPKSGNRSSGMFS
jgi:hypothetical protein